MDDCRLEGPLETAFDSVPVRFEGRGRTDVMKVNSEVSLSLMDTELGFERVKPDSLARAGPAIFLYSLAKATQNRVSKDGKSCLDKTFVCIGKLTIKRGMMSNAKCLK